MTVSAEWIVSFRDDGKAGEDDILEYQTMTKSRMIIESTSSRDCESSGDDWIKGGLGASNPDHFERVVTACQAAGVEKTKGRVALRKFAGSLGAG